MKGIGLGTRRHDLKEDLETMKFEITDDIKYIDGGKLMSLFKHRLAIMVFP